MPQRKIRGERVEWMWVLKAPAITANQFNHMILSRPYHCNSGLLNIAGLIKCSVPCEGDSEGLSVVCHSPYPSLSAVYFPVST